MTMTFTRTILASAVLSCFAACDRGGLDVPDSIPVYENTSPAAGEPSLVIDGAGAKVSMWLAGTSSVDQALYETDDGKTRVRLLIDTTTQVPRAIIDEVHGDYVIVQPTDDGGAEYLHFDGNDGYVDGYALSLDGSSYMLGELVGHPAFDGQIQGQLIAGSNVGSFAVVATVAASTTNSVDVTSSLDPIVQASGLGTSPRTAGTLHAPLSRVAVVGGVVLTGLAVGGLLAPAYGAAGVAMIFSGLFANDIADYIENKFQVDDPFAQQLRDTAVQNLRDPSTFSFGDVLRGVVDKAKQVLDGTVDPPDDDSISAQPMSGSGGSSSPSYLPPSSEPMPTSGPPSIPTNVSGQAVWTDNSVDQINGTVDDDGSMSVTGTGNMGNVTISGTITPPDVNGTFMRGGMSGTMTGTVTPVAQCMTTQASGGQGTFTNAHFVGKGPGDVTFTYDAYSIPDAFNVTVGGASKFTTGGLVSGAGSASIAVDSKGLVFVSVSAPESGTAWDYSLSCIGQ